MIDLDEGRLRAWLDGELPDADAEEVAARVENDPAVGSKVDALRAIKDRATTLMDRLTVPPPPTSRVRSVVLEAHRRQMTPQPSTRRVDPKNAAIWARRSRLVQAAALVLLLAGAASAALPGSPVREWLARTLDRGPTTSVTASEATDGLSPDEVGLTTAPETGRVRIELLDLADGSEILVRLTDAAQAAVYAPQGSRLEGEAGRIQARAVTGPIRVEIPRGLDVADLVVDGRVYLMKRGDRLELRVAPTDRSTDEIRFRAGS